MDGKRDVIELSTTQVIEEDKNYEESGYIRLPYKGADFKEFITGLLGEPQSIDGKILGKFNITINKIDNLHQLLYQRIQSQNRGQLVKFTGKITYNDNSMVTLNSISDFITYNEIEALIPVNVDLSWIYLIQFPDKEYPEKQQISIVFDVGEGYSDLSPIKLILGSRLSVLKSGTVKYKIQHTSRSWGIDIENLLKSQIKSLIEEQNKIVNFILKYNYLVSVISSIGITCVFFSLGYKYIKYKNKLRIDAINLDLDRLSSDLNGKINYLIEKLASNSFSKISDEVGVLFFVCFFVFTIVLGWISYNLDITEESFILITEEAKKMKKKKQKAIRNHWLGYIFTLITSILTGVIGNYVYAYLIK